MSRTIKHTELQPGDIFRLTQELTFVKHLQELTFVKHLNNGGLQASTKDQEDLYLGGKYVLSGEGTYVELLNRKMPTEAGTVLRVTSEKGLARESIWLRVKEFEDFGWVSQASTHMTDEEFEIFLAEDESRSFEVLVPGGAS